MNATAASSNDTNNDSLVPVQQAYHTIALHFGSHGEEIAALWLLRSMPEAEEMFPGISTAKIEFWRKGSQTPDGRSAESWKQRGYFLVGVGGGEFDEHPADGRPRKEGESALSLVADALGLADEPWLARVVDLLTHEDLHAGSGELSLMSLAKLLNAQNPDDPEAVMDWVMMGLGAKMKKELHFHRETGAEFTDKAKIETIHGPRGALKLAVVETDDEQAGRYAFSKAGGRMDLVILKRSAGNVVIMTRKKTWVDLRDIVRVVRIREMEICGTKYNFTWKMLEETEGTIKVKGADQWCYFKEGRMLLNGSNTAKDVEPTALPLEEIVTIVKHCLDPQDFEETRTRHCLSGQCTSGRRRTCPWHDLGLVRCRDIRFRMHESSEQEETPCGRW